MRPTIRPHPAMNIQRITNPRSGRSTWRRTWPPSSCGVSARSAFQSAGDCARPSASLRGRFSFSIAAGLFRQARLFSVLSRSNKFTSSPQTLGQPGPGGRSVLFSQAEDVIFMRRPCQPAKSSQNRAKYAQNPVFTRLSVVFPGASRKLRAETGLRFGAFRTMLI